MALFKTYTKSLEIGPVDLQNTHEKDLKYLFLLVLFLVFYRLCALAETKNEQRYCCQSVWYGTPQLPYDIDN